MAYRVNQGIHRVQKRKSIRPAKQHKDYLTTVGRMVKQRLADATVIAAIPRCDLCTVDDRWQVWLNTLFSR